MTESFSESLPLPLIILDLEWNQRYGRQSAALSALPQEIVEIGAVKLDASLAIVEQLPLRIKPVVYPVLHRHVQRVTGISDHEWKSGISFVEAADALRTFCGDSFTLCTWGPDDYGVLLRNFAYWMFPTDWLAAPINAQKLHGIFFGSGGQQVALQTAMEQLSVAQELPLHRALSDAYHTAKVWQKLCILGDSVPPEDPRFRALSALRTDYAQHIQTRCAVHRTPCRNAPEAANYAANLPIACGQCDKALSPYTARVYVEGKQTLEQYALCPTHGMMRIQCALQRIADGSVCLRILTTPSTEKQALQFEERHARMTPRRRRHRRPRRGPATPGLPKFDPPTP